MNLVEIADLKRKLIALVEQAGEEYYIFTEKEERKGGQKYIEFTVNIKIK